MAANWRLLSLSSFSPAFQADVERAFSSVPEPASLGAIFLGVLAIRRRRRVNAFAIGVLRPCSVGRSLPARFGQQLAGFARSGRVGVIREDLLELLLGVVGTVIG